MILGSTPQALQNVKFLKIVFFRDLEEELTGDEHILFLQRTYAQQLVHNYI